MKLRNILLIMSLAVSGCRSPEVQPPATTRPQREASRSVLGSSFLQYCAFVCVDIQAGARNYVTQEQLPKLWKREGLTADDVNAAIDYQFDVAFPNARLVADACRSVGPPMIFIHWGCLFKDGMDLDPEIRKSFLAEHGRDFDKWGHRLCDPGSRPAEFLGIREGDYVLPKSGQDAFTSSNLRFVLTNLGMTNLVFVGGHTGACLGKTARSAKRLGFRTLCVEDATFDARQSTRVQRIRETGFDYVVTTEEFLALVRAARRSDVGAGQTQSAKSPNSFGQAGAY